MALIHDAIKNDSGLVVAAKYLLNRVAPFFEMPLTGDTDKVRDFELGDLIGELEALVFRIGPSPSATLRMRFLADQVTSFAAESGAPLGTGESFVKWVLQNGTPEDRVMETVFEIDLFLDQAYSMVGTDIQILESIRKNLLINFNILQDLQEMMISGGPGTAEELDAFETAVEANLKNARRILNAFDFY
jgi:hypothetical protein